MRTNYYYFFGTVRLGRAQALIFGAALIFAVVLLFGLQAANPAHAVTRPPFTVNSTADPGDGVCNATECTLREAITAANATSAADTINFAIPGPGPHTISPGSRLPEITHPVTIDGYTEALDETTPATPNTATTGTNAVLKIELDGTSAGVAGELVLSGPGASNSVIRGLVINHFGDGIFLGFGTGYKIEGNFIGTDPSGTVAEANNIAVLSHASNSTIGGTSPAARNLISGNNFDGMQVGGQGNKIQGNLIGTKANGTEALGNGRDGMVVLDSSSNTIGDSDPSDGLANAANTIAFNTGDGVQVVQFPGSSSTGNRILSNSVYANGALGIDLSASFSPDGVTANDPKDSDTGPNRLQNYPVITSAQTIGGGSLASTSISATLESTPSTKKKKRTFIIQFFRSPSEDPTHFGEGQTFLGQIQVKTDRNGVARDDKGNSTFSFRPLQSVPAGQFITATATNKKTGDTSEFSNAEAVQGIGPGV